MTQEKKAKKAAKEPVKKLSVLKDPKVKKGLAALKRTEGKVWGERDLKEEIAKIKKQQQRLSRLLTDLEKIEHGVISKKTRGRSKGRDGRSAR